MAKRTQTKEFKLTERLLEIIDHRDEFTRGDLQGAVEAFVKINCDLREDMSFIEQLEQHKRDAVTKFR